MSAADALGLLYLALGLPLCAAGLRCFARWARGGARGWLPLGVLALALGIDALRLLDARARDAPVTWARGLVWGLLVVAGWVVARRTWRVLGRRGHSPAAAARSEAA